jgi:hypothetical protein
MNNFLIKILDLIILMIIVSFIFVIGLEIDKQEWQKDCTQMGAHRVKDVVYKCEVFK